MKHVKLFTESVVISDSRYKYFIDKLLEYDFSTGKETRYHLSLKYSNGFSGEFVVDILKSAFDLEFDIFVPSDLDADIYESIASNWLNNIHRLASLTLDMPSTVEMITNAFLNTFLYGVTIYPHENLLKKQYMLDDIQWGDYYRRNDEYFGAPKADKFWNDFYIDAYKFVNNKRAELDKLYQDKFDLFTKINFSYFPTKLLPPNNLKMILNLL